MVLDRGDLDRGSVAKHFGNPVGDLVGVVSAGNDGVGSEGGGVPDHDLVGLGSRLLGKLGIKRDVAAKDRLDVGAKAADRASAADGNTADKAKRFYNFIAVEAIGGGDPLMNIVHGVYCIT